MSIAENLAAIAENVPKVYDAGKKVERKEFWDVYQGGGNRKNWQYAFAYGGCWTDETYNPIYPITIGTTNTNMFYEATLTDTKVPLNAQGIKLNYTFRSSQIVTIPELIVNETTEISNGFTSASKLKNITITGTLGKSVAMGSCPLSVESLKNIISALKDFTGISEYSYTLTIKTSAFNELEAEGTTAEYNGTECTWAELIDNKKWNLTLA